MKISEAVKMYGDCWWIGTDFLPEKTQDQKELSNMTFQRKVTQGLTQSAKNAMHIACKA